MDVHMVNYHDMIVVLNGLAKNQEYVSQSFDQFKLEVVSALNQ